MVCALLWFCCGLVRWILLISTKVTSQALERTRDMKDTSMSLSKHTTRLPQWHWINPKERRTLIQPQRNKTQQTRVDILRDNFQDSKVHGANMGPTWVLSAPDGPHVGPMNLAIVVCYLLLSHGSYMSPYRRLHVHVEGASITTCIPGAAGTTFEGPRQPHHFLKRIDH